MKTLICSLLLLVLAGSAMARDLSEAERTSLHGQIERFDAAFKASDFATITGTVPQRFLKPLRPTPGSRRTSCAALWRRKCR